MWSLRIDPEVQAMVGAVVEIKYALDNDPPRWAKYNVRIDALDRIYMPAEPETWFFGRYA